MRMKMVCDDRTLREVANEEQKDLCPIKQVPEETINRAFCRFYYKLKRHGASILSQMLSNLQRIRFARMLWSEDIISLNKKISDTLSQVQFLTQLQQQGGVDPDTFISSSNKCSACGNQGHPGPSKGSG